MIDNWLERRLGDVIVAGGGRELRVNCPFCYTRVGREDTKHHLYVSTLKPTAYCFRCEWKGHYVSLVMSVEGCSYGQALLYIESAPRDVILFDELHSPKGLVQGHKLAREPEGFWHLHRFETRGISEGMEYKAVWKYLRRRRGVPLDLMMAKFGYVPGTNRAWILIDEDWWQGRLIIPGKPKYLSPPWPRGASLWNAEALRKYDSVVICEGVFSAMAVGPHATALCGKTMTEAQAKRIVKGAHCSQLVVMLDADAYSNGHVIADALRFHGYAGDVRVTYMLDGDPAEGVIGPSVPWTWATKVEVGLGAHI